MHAETHRFQAHLHTPIHSTHSSNRRNAEIRHPEHDHRPTVRHRRHPQRDAPTSSDQTQQLGVKGGRLVVRSEGYVEVREARVGLAELGVWVVNVERYEVAVVVCGARGGDGVSVVVVLVEWCGCG